jgi:hypothetical protein
MRAKPILLAVLASLPLGLVAMRAVVLEVRDLRDPCLHWEQSSHSGSAVIFATPRAGDPCATRSSGTSGTMAGSVVRVLLVSGGLLAAIALGILGAARSIYNLVVLTGWSMFLAIPIVFSVAPLAIVAGAGFLYVANRLRPAETAV